MRKQSYFSVGNKLFWSLLTSIIITNIFIFNQNIFNDFYIAKSIIIEDSLSKINWRKEEITSSDSLNINDSIIKKDYLMRQWTWTSLESNIEYKMKFKIKKVDYNNSVNYRANLPNYEEAWERIWFMMAQNDIAKIDDLVKNYKTLIKSNDLNNAMEVLNLIVSSAQNAPYTYVLSNSKCGEIDDGELLPPENCIPKTDPSGCCESVLPNAVYSPLEYAVNSAGDCDTKSLFAYTILKELGFDVAMLAGPGHAMLGVSLPFAPKNSTTSKPMYLKDIFGTKYYAWETTAQNWCIGDVAIETRSQWNQWKVIKY